MQKLAEKKGGKCLSEKYVNSKTKLEWKCKSGHIWKAVRHHINEGHWCPKCGHIRSANLQKSNIKEFQEIALSRGGTCLSHNYLTSKNSLKWRCVSGHVWETAPMNIKRGSWCPKCAIKKSALSRSSNIIEMKKLAKSRKGMCLSNKYINNNVKLTWQCEKKHIWRAVPSSIKSGTWCLRCAHLLISEKKAKHKFEECSKIAKKRGGMCISSKNNNLKVLDFVCSKGHKWSTKSEYVFRGSWCPKCSLRAGKDAVRLTLDQMRDIANSRGGFCLSNIYINANTHLKWKCKFGHIWNAVPAQIKKGHWCPTCNQCVGERICRRYFEKIFNSKFLKVRPSWLITKTGKRMELDGYSEELKIAFEYQGRQHYEDVTFFNNGQSFINRNDNDVQKKKLCQIRGVFLIEIPHTVKFEKIGEYIVNECRNARIRLPDKFSLLELSDLEVYDPGQMALFKKIALEKRGECLSNGYFNAKTKLKWRCEKNHLWEATPDSIKRGSWCNICANSKRQLYKKLTLAEMQDLAINNGGRCLSQKYVDVKTKLNWQCSAGHKWEAAPMKIKYGTWCPECGGVKKKTIEEMKKFAEKKGGSCISQKYINVKTKLLWECAKGHRWEAIPESVVNGHWCRKCNNRWNKHKQ